MLCILRIKYPYILDFGSAAISSELKVINPLFSSVRITNPNERDIFFIIHKLFLLDKQYNRNFLLLIHMFLPLFCQSKGQHQSDKYN